MHNEYGPEVPTKELIRVLVLNVSSNSVVKAILPKSGIGTPIKFNAWPNNRIKTSRIVAFLKNRIFLLTYLLKLEEQITPIIIKGVNVSKKVIRILKILLYSVNKDIKKSKIE